MRVAIIGGGSSGSTAAKACLEANLEPTVFERDMSLGGLWKSGSGGRVWSSLKTNLSKHTCCFSDFRWPEDVPDFPSSSRLRQYIEDYASCFQLGQHVRFGHFVTAVTPFYPDGDDDPNTLMWSVTFTSTRHEQPSTRCSSEASEDPGDAFHESSSGEHDVVQRTEIFDKCIIASGIFSEPNLPPASKVGGIAAAVEKGWATHGATYRDPGSYAGKAVLVVGCAFSGAEIACDLSGVTKRCLAATGRPSIFLPRFVAVDNPEEDASLPARANIADKLSSVEASADASETGPLPGAIARRSRESDSDVPSESIGDEDRSEEEEGAVCQRDDGPAGTTKPKIIPLDLALYSLKSWYEGKASTASALEKREGARKFLVHLAGRDPGDAHEALRLSGSASSNHDPQASSVRVVVSDDFLDEVEDGSIEIRPRLMALDVRAKTAKFWDGTCDSVDHVIFCTGLQPSLRFLSEEVLHLLEYDEQDLLQPLILHLQTWNPRVPNLGFVGMYRGPYFGSMELQARWLTRMWAGEVPPPAEITTNRALEEARFVRSSTPRPQFPTDYVDLMEGLATAAGLLPPTPNIPIERSAEDPSAVGSTNRSEDRSPGSTAVAPSGRRREQAATFSTDLAEGTASGIRTDAHNTIGVSSVRTLAADAGEAMVGDDHTARIIMRAITGLITGDGSPGQQEKEGKAQEERAMRLLGEWIWSGPFLPCHYHVRQFLPSARGQRGAMNTWQRSPVEAHSHEARPRLRGSLEDRIALVEHVIAEIQHVNRKLDKAHRARS